MSLPYLFHHFRDSYIAQISSTFKRGLLTAIEFTIYITLYLGVFYAFIASSQIKEPPVAINDTYNIIEPNVFIYAVDAYPHQKYYQCLTNNIAKTFFQYEIIDTQFITDHPDQDKFLEKHKIKNWDENDTFEIAIKNYMKVNSQYFEECYVNTKYIVAKKDKTVIRIEKDESISIDEQLKMFINI